LCATVSLLLAAPIMAIVAIAIKLSADGPALYSQRRVGMDGIDFTIYKFRTMIVGAEDGIPDEGEPARRRAARDTVPAQTLHDRGRGKHDDFVVVDQAVRGRARRHGAARGGQHAERHVLERAHGDDDEPLPLPAPLEPSRDGREQRAAQGGGGGVRPLRRLDRRTDDEVLIQAPRRALDLAPGRKRGAHDLLSRHGPEPAPLLAECVLEKNRIGVQDALADRRESDRPRLGERGVGGA
jgi:hypothetical protein